MRILTVTVLFLGMMSSVLTGSEHFITFADFSKSGHLQGIAGNDKFIFRVFNYEIIKSDLNGKTLKIAECKRDPGKWMHAGSPCLVRDRLYVPCNFSGFNRELNGKPSLNYIQVFDLDLNYIKSYHIPELQYGAGCITFADNRFFAAGGRPYQLAGNAVYEYDTDFKFIKKHDLNLTTYVGIQTITYDGKDFFLGCYGNQGMSYRVSRDFQNISYYKFGSALGIMPVSANKMLVAVTSFSEHRAKIIQPDKYLLQKKYIDIDRNGIGFFEGKKYIDLSALRRRVQNHVNSVFVIRCSRAIPVECFISVKQYFPKRHVIKITD